jgi:hypothetical protein
MPIPGRSYLIATFVCSTPVSLNKVNQYSLIR